jgi:hypothetical protein
LYLFNNPKLTGSSVIIPGGYYVDRRQSLQRPGPGSLIAPPDPSARWDDPAGYDHPDEDEFEATGQHEVNGKRGFVFHDACWSLLEHKKLFEVCGSLPPSPVLLHYLEKTYSTRFPWNYA